MNLVRNCVVIVGLGAIALGLFLSERPDQPSLGLDDQHCIDPPSPSLDGAASLSAFCVEVDRLFRCHSGEVNW